MANIRQLADEFYHHFLIHDTKPFNRAVNTEADRGPDGDVPFDLVQLRWYIYNRLICWKHHELVALLVEASQALHGPFDPFADPDLQAETACLTDTREYINPQDKWDSIIAHLLTAVIGRAVLAISPLVLELHRSRRACRVGEPTPSPT